MANMPRVITYVTLARILSEPEDQEFGDRHHRVEDVEGHRWMFAQRIRA